MRKTVSLVVACLLLSGCVATRLQDQAPAVTYGLQGGAGSAGMHTVVGNDTLWNIAERYKLSMQDIIYVNGLQPPYDVRPLQRLRLPPPAVYKVKAGDTLYGISRMFGITQTQVARLNNLRAPYAVKVGDTLRLPAMRVAVSAPPPARVMKNAMLPPQPLSSRNAEIMTEQLPPPGQYPHATGGQSSLKIQTVERSPIAPPPVERTVLAPPSTPAPMKAQPVVAKAPPKNILSSGMPPRASSKFVWPVEGPVISAYGNKKGGVHNDGINIKAPKGAPVRAADNGIIVYADNELKGFGNLVLIRHADKWVTAYAHLDRTLVKKGQMVEQGESIGTVGSSGSADSPQLHFETRRGTDAVDPAGQLKARGR